jgi:transposase
MHEVFEGNTFEGHTMLAILKRFEQRVGSQCKPVIVADAAMLSAQNMQQLDEQGYRFIVGARLANHSKTFIDQIDAQMPRIDEATARFEHTMKKDKVTTNVNVVCQFSLARFKKDKRELDKQLIRAQLLLKRNEPGRRARFVKKAEGKDSYQLNVELKAKAEKLLGIKGYVTNIPQTQLSNQDVISYYHDLWHVEQAFRMSKSDLQARPIYHRNELTIKSHVLICFMALMMGKYLEIKTHLCLKRIRKALWRVHEAHLRDDRTGKVHIKRTSADNPQVEAIMTALKLEVPH